MRYCCDMFPCQVSSSKRGGGGCFTLSGGPPVEALRWCDIVVTCFHAR